MSASEPPRNNPPESDPSMEDILASIRRILSEEDAPADAVSPHGPGHPPDMPHPAELPPQEWQREIQNPLPPHSHRSVNPAPQDGSAMPPDLLILDSSMMIPEPALADTSVPEPPIPPLVPLMNPQNTDPSSLLAPAVAAAAATSVGSMMRNIVADRAAQVHSGGPTLEDIVRDELRPLLKQWLDEHLPVMVERLVRVELERVIGRATG
jgi:cell pole-organizing protein PopZ